MSYSSLWQSVWMRRVLVLLLVAGHLLLTAAYSVWNPLGEAPDEADHWAYIVYLAREQQLPEGPRVTQSKHPPFYHVTAAVVASLAEPDFEFLRANPDVSLWPVENWSPNFFVHTTLEAWPWQGGALAFHLARAWSVLLSTGMVAAAYAMMRAALPARPGLALAAAGVLAFLPEPAFIGGSANNDNAAALFGTLAMWGALAIYRAGGHWRAGWWTPLALGFGFLSKVSTVALWPVVGLAILLGGAQRADGSIPGIGNLARNWLRWSGAGVWVFVPALLLASPWLARNWWLYGDPLGMEMARQTVDLRTTPWGWEETVWLLRGWFISFWGKFGGAGHVAMADWVYWMMALLSVASGLGLLYEWIVRGRRDKAGVEWGIVLLLVLGCVAVAAGIWRYSLIALGTDQARLLFPALAPLVLLLVWGLSAWVPHRFRESAFPVAGGIALIAGSLVLGIYGLVGVILPAFAPPEPPSALELAEVEVVTPVQLGELSLVGWRLDGQPVLYWRADAPPVMDYRSVVRVTTEDGALVWEWRRSPGYGRWSTDRWPVGAIVRDEYPVGWPEWAGAGRYRVEVALYPFGGEPILPIQDGGPAADAAHPYFFVGWLPH